MARRRLSKTAARLERFAESQSMDVEAINPFAPPPTPIRRRLRAAAPDAIVFSIGSYLDAQVLADAAEPGDVWLNVSRFDAWGTTRRRRAFLADESAGRSDWDDVDLYTVGVALGIWTDDEPYEANRTRNRRRLRRLQAGAAARRARDEEAA
jgi:hypothetical protein